MRHPGNSVDDDEILLLPVPGEDLRPILREFDESLSTMMQVVFDWDQSHGPLLRKSHERLVTAKLRRVHKKYKINIRSGHVHSC